MDSREARKAADDHAQVTISNPAFLGSITGRVQGYTEEPMILVVGRDEGSDFGKVAQWFPISAATITNPEPTAFGAIVVDDEDEKWVRRSDESGTFWINRHGVEAPWRRIRHPRILSWGVL